MHVYDRPATYQVTVGAVDEDTALTATPQTLSPVHTVVVGVQANQGTAGGAYVINEGDSLTLAASGPGAATSFTWDINGDGVYGDATGAGATISWSALNALPAPFIRDNGTWNVSVKIGYANGASITRGTSLTVNNVAPTFDAIVNNGPVNEGSTNTIVQIVGAKDPATADVLTYAFDFNNDGVLDTAFGSSNSVVVPVQYLRQSGTLVVRGVVKDDDGGSAEGTTTIVVNDVPPTLTVAEPQRRSKARSTSSRCRRPTRQRRHLSRWVVDWGDGNVVGYAATGNITVQYTYGDNRTPESAPTVIKVSAVDNDGIYQAADKAITVANAAPTLSNLVITPIFENGVARLSGTIADPGKLDSFTISVDWRDGSAVEDFSFAAGTSAFDVTHRYLQDGVYTVGVALTDKDGGRDQGSVALTVTNVAPVMTAFAVTGGTTSIEETRAISVTGAYTDVGTLDTHTVVIDWGDGTTSSSTRGRADFDPTLIVNALNRTFTASHAYADDNPTGTPSDFYAITATVTDEKGASDSAATGITVVNVAPKVGALAFNGVAAITAPEKGGGGAHDHGRRKRRSDHHRSVLGYQRRRYPHGDDRVGRRRGDEGRRDGRCGPIRGCATTRRRTSISTTIRPGHRRTITRSRSGSRTMTAAWRRRARPSPSPTFRRWSRPSTSTG